MKEVKNCPTLKNPVSSASVCRSVEEAFIAAGCKQPSAKKAENKTLALPQGSLWDEAGVGTDEAAVSVGQSTQLTAAVAKEGTGGTGSTEAHEPTQHPRELDPGAIGCTVSKTTTSVARAPDHA